MGNMNPKEFFIFDIRGCPTRRGTPTIRTFFQTIQLLHKSTAWQRRTPKALPSADRQRRTPKVRRSRNILYFPIKKQRRRRVGPRNLVVIGSLFDKNDTFFIFLEHNSCRIFYLNKNTKISKQKQNYFIIGAAEVPLIFLLIFSSTLNFGFIDVVGVFSSFLPIRQIRN